MSTTEKEVKENSTCTTSASTCSTESKLTEAQLKAKLEQEQKAKTQEPTRGTGCCGG